MISILFSNADRSVGELSRTFRRVTQLCVKLFTQLSVMRIHHEIAYVALRWSPLTEVFFFVERYPWEKKKKKRDGIRAQGSGVQGVQGTRNSGESREFV